MHKQPMPLLLLSAALLLAAGPAYAQSQDYDLRVDPSPVVAGKPSALVITSQNTPADIAEFPNTPEITWHQGKNVGQTTQIVNFKMSTQYVTSYTFTVAKPGMVTIPGIEIVVNKKKILSKPLKIKVVANPLDELDKYFFIKCAYLKDIKNDSIYLGEDIPLEIQFFSVESLKADPIDAAQIDPFHMSSRRTYPQVSAENIVLDDFGSFNKEHDRFAPYPYREAKENVDGVSYRMSSYLTSFRAMSPGEITGSIVLQFAFLPPRQRGGGGGGRDPFFSDLFDQKWVSKTVSTSLPKLKVLPLPPAPPDAFFLGIVGEWKVDIALSQEKLAVGEPTSLDIDISGNGSLESLRTPKISFPDFNIYPPEIKKDGVAVAGQKNSASIKFVMIPTKPGPTNVDVALATFDPRKGEYVKYAARRPLDIAQGKGNAAGAVISAPGPVGEGQREAAAPKQQEKASEALLYLKKQEHGSVSIPLWRNNIGLMIILLLLGPSLFAAAELRRRRAARLGGDPVALRRHTAMASRGRIVKALARTPDGSLASFVQEEVVPHVNDILGLPPGTSANELAGKVPDPALAECLRDAEAMSFMPGQTGDAAGLRAKLDKSLRKLSAYAVLASCALLASAGASAAVEELPPPSFDSVLSAYDDGDFQKAERLCESHVSDSNPDPHWIFNLGDCAYQKGDIVKALVCFERALRLSPRDSDILENLNYVRRKLLLPEVYKNKHPLDLLASMRDSLRPDEWLLLLGVFWLSAWAAAAASRLARTQRKVLIGFMAAGAAAAVLCAAAIVSQRATTYNPANAIILERNAPVHTLPSAKSPQTKLSLGVGEEVKVVERRNDWCRVRTGKAEGWIPSKAVALLWHF